MRFKPRNLSVLVPDSKPNQGNKVTPKVPRRQKAFDKGRSDQRPMSGKSGDTRYGAYGKFKGVRFGDARRLAQAEIRTDLNELRMQGSNVRRETAAERERLRRQYQAAMGDINHIYNETGDYIGYQNQAIQDNYSALTDRSQQAQAALLQFMQQGGAAVEADVTGDMARLGINAGSVMGQFAADQSNMEQLAKVTGANNLANIDAQAQGANDVGMLLSGMNQGSRGAAVGTALKAQSDGLFEAEANKRLAINEVRTAMRDVRRSRGDLTRQLLEQMLQSKWGQYMDTAQLGLQREQMDMQRQAARAYSQSGGGRDYTDFTSSGWSGSGGYSGGGSSGGGSGSGGSAPSTPGADSNYNEMIIKLLQGSGGGGLGRNPKLPKGSKKGK